LPHLELTGRYHRTGRHQATAAGGRFLPLSDQAITEWSLQLQQNVFAPESWFMYTAYTKGKDIKRLVEKRTMQQLALRITTHFYACLALNEQQLALRASRDHAARLVEEIKALKREGLVSNSELEKAEAFFTSTQVAVKRNKRNLKQTKATLLRTMGLYPATDIKLRHGYQLQASDQTLSERIATALVSRPELATADRMVAVNEDQIKMAVSQFLPQLGVFADLSYSSNSFLKYQRLLTYGASGVMAVFEGFANVAAYKKATKDAEKQRLKREQLCLNIMLEVIRAHTAFSDAKDREQVARKKEDAAIESFYEIRAKWREGLVLKSALLEATRTYTKATTNFVTAKYQTQVAVATLLTAMGTFSGDELWRD
jgi:outer membrane protein TolC